MTNSSCKVAAQSPNAEHVNVNLRQIYWDFFAVGGDPSGSGCALSAALEACACALASVDGKRCGMGNEARSDALTDAM